MRAAGLATVVAAGPSSKFHVGDIVYGVVGWQEYAVLDDKELRLIMYVSFSLLVTLLAQPRTQAPERSEPAGLPWRVRTYRPDCLLRERDTFHTMVRSLMVS
jgi:hypothetical protein